MPNNMNPLNISFVLIQHDQEDPDAYYEAIKADVSTRAAGISAGLGSLTGPAAVAVAGPLLQGLIPTVSKQLNIALGEGPDLIGTSNITLNTKQLVLFTAHTGESMEKQIPFKLATPLLTGDGVSYKGYFDLTRV